MFLPFYMSAPTLLSFKLFSSSVATVARKKRTVGLPLVYQISKLDCSSLHYGLVSLEQSHYGTPLWGSFTFESSKAKSLASQTDEASNVKNSMSENGFCLWFKCLLIKANPWGLNLKHSSKGYMKNRWHSTGSDDTKWKPLRSTKWPMNWQLRV